MGLQGAGAKGVLLVRLTEGRVASPVFNVGSRLFQGLGALRNDRGQAWVGPVEGVVLFGVVVMVVPSERIKAILINVVVIGDHRGC